MGGRWWVEERGTGVRSGCWSLVVGCGLWAVGCGLWAVGCGLWAVGLGCADRHDVFPALFPVPSPAPHECPTHEGSSVALVHLSGSALGDLVVVENTGGVVTFVGSVAVDFTALSASTGPWVRTCIIVHSSL